jgi:signal transduction histidine kinase
MTEGNIERRRLIDLLSPNEAAFQVRAPIAFDGNLVGEVSIGFSNKSTYDFLAFGRRQAVIIVFVAVLSSCLMIWVLVRAITKPLVNIVKIAKRIADGDLSQIIEPGNGDEIGQLSKSLQDMAAKIKFSQAGTKNQALKEHLRRSAPLAEFGQMAASVANEIRNPLAGISGCSQILKMKSGRDPIRDELLDMILKDVGRLEEVVGRFIEFAHLSGFELQSTQITELLEDPLTLIDDQANVQRVKLERDYQHEETSLVVDGNQLKQALLHVFTNALQAMPHGGHLQIKTMNDEELLCILVSDTGNSITSDMHERIFDPFFTTKTQGVGLGLSIARMIIEKHNGTIHVNNGRDHKKFFRIELPLDHSRKEDKNPMVVGGNKE